MENAFVAVVLQLLQSAPAIILSATVAVLLWQNRDMLPAVLRRLEGVEAIGVRVSLASLRGATREKDGFDASAASQLRSVERRLRKEGHRLSGVKILWIDDRPSNNYYESQILIALGAKVAFAASTKEVERLLFERQRRFDLIISDWERPEAVDAGPTLLRILRNRGDQTPFLFYTRRRNGVPEGAQGLATHPSRLIELLLKYV